MYVEHGQTYILLESDGKIIYYPEIPDPDHTNVPMKTPIAFSKTAVERACISITKSFEFLPQSGS